MYLHLGQSVAVPEREIIGIFDLDNTTGSKRTREFLNRAEREGCVASVGEDLPKSFILCQGKRGTAVYLSQLSSATLKGRAEALYQDKIKQNGII
ncbi:MAG: DUF370 domain-containing protein [Oscillospiraceae bacterium]|nr:DUF370 domain-containing protein [Oscillospiraceae bacterium]